MKRSRRVSGSQDRWRGGARSAAGAFRADSRGFHPAWRSAEGDTAERRAFFDDGVLLFDVLLLVVNEWDAVTALLRAPMDESILADIEEARAGAAVPRIGKTADEVFLETIVVSEGEDAGFKAADLLIDAELAFRESVALAGAVVDNTDRAVEAEGAGTARDSEGVLGVFNGDAQHGVDGDGELGFTRQPLEFALKDA